MFIRYPRLFFSGLILFCCACLIFTLTQWDIIFSHFFILSSQNPIVSIVKIISKTGSFIVITSLTCILAVWLWLRKYRYDAVWVLCTMASCRLLFALIKLIINRHRPYFSDPLTHAITASFPSGHACNSLAFFLVCYFITNKKKAVLCFGIIWGIMIGWTRLALGAHWVSDVLAGWGGALMWIALMYQFRSSTLFQTLIDRYSFGKCK